MSRFPQFSSSYAEARGKFLDSCAALGITPERHEHPEKGPNGEDLSTDVASIGPADAPAVLVLNSATHGVEGFCGSGAFVGLLCEGLVRELPAGVGLVLVHAINPHGFAHVRRVTEGNIDLNRNFLDHAKPHPTTPAYDEVHALLVPADWDGPARGAAERGIESYVARHGITAYQAAACGGQYGHPDGLFYGGRTPTWSNRTWRAILGRHTAGRERVAVIDFHTGLGPRCYGELQYEGSSAESEYERAQRWFDGEVTSSVDGSSSSPVVQGHIGLGSHEAAPAGAEVTFVGLEYGTRPFPQVLDALRADNWLYLRGTLDSALGREIKAAIRDAFYG
ncbi:MAG: M14 family metallopeptidase, partial [Alphaproteobacteria bacterium]